MQSGFDLTNKDNPNPSKFTSSALQFPFYFLLLYHFISMISFSVTDKYDWLLAGMFEFSYFSFPTLHPPPIILLLLNFLICHRFLLCTAPGMIIWLPNLMRANLYKIIHFFFQIFYEKKQNLCFRIFHSDIFSHMKRKTCMFSYL